MSSSNKVKPKIYAVWTGGRKPPEAPDMLIRALTKQGALALAATKTMTCEYADQNLLYEATKAGVPRIDIAADVGQETLPNVEQVATS